MNNETQRELFERILGYLKKPDSESLKLSISNTHAEGLFSLVVKGTEFGKLSRIFIAEKGLQPFDVQLHTHRYPINLTTIKGDITHLRAYRSERGEGVWMSEYEYHSVLNGGNGLKYLDEAFIRCYDYKLPIGSTLRLSNEDYHTMTVSKGSMWIVEELGYETETSKVLGIPFDVKGLYLNPTEHYINTMRKLVALELTTIAARNNYRGIVMNLRSGTILGS